MIVVGGMDAMTTRTKLLMLTSTAVLLAGCASQSARDRPESGANAGPADAPQVLEKKFQEAAKGYQRVEKDRPHAVLQAREAHRQHHPHHAMHDRGAAAPAGRIRPADA
jgi:hypothetical protein